MYMPRELLQLIESYIRLEDLSDEDQGRRVKRISWPISTTNACCSGMQRMTGFVFHHHLYWIIHVGNTIDHIYRVTNADGHIHLYLQLESDRSIELNSGADSMGFHGSEMGLSSFYLLNWSWRRDDMEEDANLLSTSLKSILRPRANGIIKRAEKIFQVAEIILSHLPFKEKFKLH